MSSRFKASLNYMKLCLKQNKTNTPPCSMGFGKRPCLAGARAWVWTQHPYQTVTKSQSGPRSEGSIKVESGTGYPSCTPTPSQQRSIGQGREGLDTTGWELWSQVPEVQQAPVRTGPEVKPAGLVENTPLVSEQITSWAFPESPGSPARLVRQGSL